MVARVGQNETGTSALEFFEIKCVSENLCDGSANGFERRLARAWCGGRLRRYRAASNGRG